jgi:hypothetical protein
MAISTAGNRDLVILASALSIAMADNGAADTSVPPLTLPKLPMHVVWR